ncbi:MAG: chromate efflux transporter [Cellvibrionaceae bacterium]
MKTISDNPVNNKCDSPSWMEMLKVWCRIGFLSFGGPAAQIALMHSEVVEQKKWLTEKQYLNALSFCMLLPGPEAMQLATYAGWRLQGTLGGLLAGLLFVLPGALVILVLATMYSFLGDMPTFTAFFLGVKAVVIVVVVQALMRISAKSLLAMRYWVTAIVSFVAIFFLAIPFPLIVAVAALYGFFSAERNNRTKLPASKKIPFKKTLTTIIVWLVIWWLPLLSMLFFLPDSILTQLGLFFSKLAVVTFGGAYAVLSYMAQDVVTQFGWLTATEMMDGLGLAETTPGPLILVTEFVGFIAAANQASLWMGIAGAVVSLWATFVPCFLWVFTFAPYVEKIAHQPRLSSALSAITAAVVGVIANLSAWFALHVVFQEVQLKEQGIFSIWFPAIETIDWRAIVLIMINAVLLFKYRWGIIPLLGLSSCLGALFVLNV